MSSKVVLCVLQCRFDLEFWAKAPSHRAENLEWVQYSYSASPRRNISSDTLARGGALVLCKDYEIGTSSVGRKSSVAISRFSAFMYALALATMMSVSEPRPT